MTVSYDQFLEYLEHVRNYLANLDGVENGTWYTQKIVWKKLEDNTIEIDSFHTKKVEDE